jgi:erythromycin esterase-like protein
MNTLIYNISKDVNIFAMGEATHGQSLITQMRIKIFKTLVKKYDYNVFVLEENYSVCERINKYINNKGGNIGRIMFEMMLPWKHSHIRNLIEWMRLWNKNNNNNKLEFKGIDFRDDETKYPLPKKDLIRLKRDEGMFKIFMSFYNSSNKYFVYAHMGHLQKVKFWNIKWFGVFMFKQFKSKYYVIGNTFYNGSYIGRDENKNYKMNKITITSKMTEHSNQLPTGFNIITPKSKSLNLFESGATVSSLKPMETFQMTFVKNRFDAIIVINNEYPFRVLKF